MGLIGVSAFGVAQPPTFLAPEGLAAVLGDLIAQNLRRAELKFDLMEQLGPRPEGARYLLTESYGLAQKMFDNRPREPFYAAIDLETMAEEETIMAYERNGEELEDHQVLGERQAERLQKRLVNPRHAVRRPVQRERELRANAVLV